MRTPLLVSLIALTLSACAEEAPVVEDSLRSQVVGIWAPDDPGLFQFMDQPRFESLTLDADGSGSVVYRHADTNVLTCMVLRWDVAEASVVLSFEPNEITFYFFDGLWGAEVVGDTLTLTGDLGVSTTLTSLAALPDGGACEDVSSDEELFAPWSPYSESNLAYDGARDLFWYADSDDAQLVPVNASGAPVMVAPLSFSTSNLRSMQAYDGTNEQFWFRETWTNSNLSCRDRSDADCGTIDTTALGAQTEVHTATIHGTSLWLHGRSNTGPRQFLEIDLSSGNLLRTVTFDAELEAIAFDGTDMWAILDDMGGPLVQIDLSTREAVASYRAADFPPVLHRWEGLTFADGDLWVMMTSGLGGEDGVTLRQLSFGE